MRFRILLRFCSGSVIDRTINKQKIGKNTLEIGITNISQHGFWLLADNRELFVGFKEFPWFIDATISAILHVERLTSDHLYWPDLDVDLTIESIEHPERFPLKSK
jgi:hypothetical protein